MLHCVMKAVHEHITLITRCIAQRLVLQLASLFSKVENKDVNTQTNIKYSGNNMEKIG